MIYRFSDTPHLIRGLGITITHGCLVIATSINVSQVYLRETVYLTL